MGNIQTILNQRLNKKSTPSTKMAAMAQKSASGNLTTFAGLFSVTELSEKEKTQLETLLQDYSHSENRSLQSDLKSLISITSEVKAINNQAALLHGERVKKAHNIFVNYKEGAFTAWLLAAYGNRQTPYNLMQYYEFYTSLPKDLKPKIEAMPRQAVYSLASRTGLKEKKEEIVKNYKGESKLEVIRLIRLMFPLEQKDKRKRRIADHVIQNLEKISDQIVSYPSEFNPREKRKIRDLLSKMLEQFS